MSSNPFADLADTLDEFAAGLGSLQTSYPDSAPGSIAANEADPEIYAGEWGDHPAADVLSAAGMLTWSVIDHLAATAALIRLRRMASTHTLVRAAAEHTGRACYFSEPGIDALERVRRGMNYRLDSLSHLAVMLSSVPEPGTAVQLRAKEDRIETIARTGRQFGLTFRKRKGFSPAWLGEQPPGATGLIDDCASATPGLGRLYQQILSSATHGNVFGLTQFLRGGLLLDDAPPGQVLAQPVISARDLARYLLAGPLCASTLVERLRDYAGWDIGSLEPVVIRMLTTWGRIAGLPYSGPVLVAQPVLPPGLGGPGGR